MRFPGEEGVRNPARLAPGRGRASGWVGPPGVGGTGLIRLGRGGTVQCRRTSRARSAAERALGLVRAGPPFPYLRWTGPPLPPPRCERRGEVVRQRRARRRPRAPVTGMREREPRGVQELAREPVAARRAVLGVAGDRMPDRQQVRADLVRAARLEPHAQQRVVRQRPLDLEVRDRLARLVRVGRDPRAHAPVAAERRVDRAAPRRRAALDQRQVLAHELARARAAALSAAWTGSERATTSRPDVSRSSRCTMPARSGSSPPATRPASACASVPWRCPRAGWHDHAGRLVDDDQVLVLPGDANGVGRGRPAGAAPARLLDAHQLAAARARGAWPSRRRRPSRARRRSAAAPRRASPRARRGRRPGARPPPPPGRSAHAASASRAAVAAVPRARRSAPRTPTVIAMSATLNAGKCGNLTKSVTEPSRARSIRLPIAPPSSSPVGQPDERPAGVRDEEDHEREQRHGGADDEQRAAVGEEAERDARVAHVDELRRPATRSWRSPSSSPSRTSAFVSWSSATTTAAVAAAASDVRPGLTPGRSRRRRSRRAAAGR